MQIKPGTQLASTVCDTQVVVVRAPDEDVEITCGGAIMLPASEVSAPTGSPDPAQAEGTQIGKRYQHEDLGLEMLCTRAGTGSLAVNGEPVGTREAKAVPSSD